MPAQAVVLVNTDVGKENDIFNKLIEFPEVKEVYMVYGIYDIIVIVEASTMDDLRTLITERIRKLDGVKTTLTSIVVMHRKK
ncbi:MAG: Lrp/AsnC ligand binding domain-containing protein [Desulfurococcales archaeon]|nr:Lrp/AsnC ligand binding domain-containing protein [Desulfurococcales archaeon]